ncbi:MAG TPA: hypothetical protein VFW98_13235 [Gemmatimonadaceae bacterium]|nr:hypothetical protein [Gemmatimonadaceae bacterium]
MRKAIQLRVLLWIEGEDEPADDFAALTTRAVREVIRAGAAHHPELRMTIKGIREDEGE